MDRYGSDKPDVRFGMELVDLTDAVRGVDFRVFAEPIAAGGRVRGIVAPGCGGFVTSRAGRADRPRAAPRRRGAGPPGGRGRRLADRPGRQVPWRVGRRDPRALGASAGDLILIVAHADAMRAPRRLATSAWRWAIGWSCATPGVLAYVLDPPLPDVQVGP